MVLAGIQQEGAIFPPRAEVRGSAEFEIEIRVFIRECEFEQNFRGEQAKVYFSRNFFEIRGRECLAVQFLSSCFNCFPDSIYFSTGTRCTKFFQSER